MKILGLDTSSKYLSLGIYDNDKIYEYTLETGRKLSALIMPSIDRVLRSLGLEARDMDYFACGLGPGSFTGIRVGLATVKGLSWSVKKPTVGVSTLDILALNAQNHPGYIIPVIDAKRNLIYASIYTMQGHLLKRQAPYMLSTPEELIKKVRKFNCVLLGDAADLWRQKLQLELNKAVILDNDYWYPKACNILNLALLKIRKHQTNNPFDIKPIYLYPKECQIRSVTSKSVTRN